MVTTLHDYQIYANIEICLFDRDERYQTMEEALVIQKTLLANYIEADEQTEDKPKAVLPVQNESGRIL